MFQSLACTHALSEEFGPEHSEFMLSVRFEAENRLPLTRFEVYSYSTSDATYFYGFRKQKVIKHEAAVCSKGNFKKEDFVKGFRIFSKTLNLLEARDKFMIMGDEYLVRSLLPLVEEFNLTYAEYPARNYYMSKKQEELLMSSEPLAVPEGYTLGSCSPDDAELITDVWIHKGPGEDLQTRMKITCFPSSCIYFQGKPVAFEVVHANGMQNHLYVMKEHQGKGLGFIVEQDLARKQIKEGLFVYKTVETFNESVIKHSDRSPFWSLKKKADGSPLLKLYVAIWPGEEDERH